MERTKTIISKMDMCQCDKCFFDVCALVLNKLPPQYVTTEKGNLMMKVPATSAKMELELTILISRSAKMVRDKPMH
ncbi:MAG: late competence development ComFB family protein [Clostridiales bacterium]|nr:late competence development ComFB family protein [Clostridiales bacterium]